MSQGSDDARPELLDRFVQRIFRAGLLLDSSAGSESARQDVIDELDEALKDVRTSASSKVSSSTAEARSSQIPKHPSRGADLIRTPRGHRPLQPRVVRPELASTTTPHSGAAGSTPSPRTAEPKQRRWSPLCLATGEAQARSGRSPRSTSPDGRRRASSDTHPRPSLNAPWPSSTSPEPSKAQSPTVRPMRSRSPQARHGRDPPDRHRPRPSSVGRGRRARKRSPMDVGARRRAQRPGRSGHAPELARSER